MQEAPEKLKIDQLSETERKIYQRYKESRWIEKDVIQTAEKKGLDEGLQQGLQQGLKKGIQQGLKQGINQGKIAIAQNYTAKHIDNQTIADLAELSIADIENLRQK